MRDWYQNIIHLKPNHKYRLNFLIQGVSIKKKDFIEEVELKPEKLTDVKQMEI